MIRKADNASIKEFEKLGFKYGARDKIIYKTKKDGLEAKIYIDLLPCNNNNNELIVESESRTVPEKILDKLYDLFQAGLVERI